jgi:hypothetical protein
MSHLVASIGWCWIQVLLVAGVAWVLSILALRRSPAMGAAIAWYGVIATLVLTGLALAPLPHWTSLHVLERLVFKQEPNEEAPHFKTRQAMVSGKEMTEESGFQAALKGPLIVEFLTSMRNSEAAVARHYGASRWAFGIFAIGCGVGLLRMVYGIGVIAHLRRRSTVIPEVDLIKLLSELSHSFQMRHLPNIRETSDLDSAAVVGWWRPYMATMHLAAC